MDLYAILKWLKSFQSYSFLSYELWPFCFFSSFMFKKVEPNYKWLQDDGTYEAVPGSDFVITRVAFRDNSSKYYINDRSSNFTEVTKKLKGKGVDLDNNRFLILQVAYFIWFFLVFCQAFLFISFDVWPVSFQGEVEQISLMKPKAQGPHDEGFLEYLEDIIGTNKYVEKIDESYKQWAFFLHFNSERLQTCNLLNQNYKIIYAVCCCYLIWLLINKISGRFKSIFECIWIYFMTNTQAKCSDECNINSL